MKKQKLIKSVASLGTVSLLALLTALPTLAATTSGLDTIGTDQIFAVQGQQVGDWKTNLLAITTPLTVTGVITGTTVTATGAVNGATVSATGLVSGGSISTVGTVTASAYYHSSDARLKTDIHPIKGALDKLLEIRGVEFSWKKDGRPDMGVVAQNVAQVFPNVVARDANGVMSVEYDSMVGPMIEAIRQLKAENDDLRQKVGQLDDMKAQLNKVTATVNSMKKHDAQSVSWQGETAKSATATATP